MSKIINRYNENNINYLIGCFIRKARRARGMSGKEFSQKLNISHQQLSRYERGLTSFTLCKLILFLRALEKNINDLLTEIHWNENKDILLNVDYQ